MPTLADYYTTFAHRFAKETGEQLDDNAEAMFYAGARAALDATRHTGIDPLLAECKLQALPKDLRDLLKEWSDA